MLPKGDDQARTMHSMLLLGLLPRLEGKGHAPGATKSRSRSVPIATMKEESYGTFTRRYTRPGPRTIS